MLLHRSGMIERQARPVLKSSQSVRCLGSPGVPVAGLVADVWVGPTALLLARAGVDSSTPANPRTPRCPLSSCRGSSTGPGPPGPIVGWNGCRRPTAIDGSCSEFLIQSEEVAADGVG